jgi:hypothetical protein
MFLDPIGWASAGRSLAAKPPALLIDRYMEFSVMFGSGEFESSGNRRAPPANDCHFDLVIAVRH